MLEEIGRGGVFVCFCYHLCLTHIHTHIACVISREQMLAYYLKFVLKILIFVYVYMFCLHACLHTMCKSGAGALGTPGPGVTGGCELSCGAGN